MKKYIILVLLSVTLTYSQVKKYIIYCDKDVLETSLQIGYGYIGKTELTGNNDGVWVRNIQKCIPIGRKDPYCEAGQYKLFDSACTILKLQKYYIPILRTGSTVFAYNDAQNRGIQIPFVPSKHDLLYWKLPNKVSGHVERIDTVYPKAGGWVQTVGFNTSSGKIGSQDNGDGCWRKLRCIYNPLGHKLVRGLIGFYYLDSNKNNILYSRYFPKINCKK